ncbi:dihydrofolate reductase [Salinisphaera sp. USBA-960]|nr:dihydrofolate reductase [Salifodinibacter halophilus]NNC26441.1 dihydrofolate reductase [Salifodinibacter halophilus]
MWLTAIAAMDRNDVIGSHGGMPWHLPADLRWFQNQTYGKPVLMGRKTRQSIRAALPGRRNLVLTRQSDLQFDDCEMVRDLDEAIQCIDPATDGDELMILGGAEIYALALPRTTRLLITRIEAEYIGDTWFPPFEWSMWHKIDEQIEPASNDRPLCRFQTFDRRDA